MNSLFVALLTLFFSQGLIGRDNWGARGVALAFVTGLMAVFLYSLG
jgi:hypothetical protein